MTLESDIDRIARLRGKKVDDYVAKLNAPRPINGQLLANAFNGNGDICAEMRIFDKLPRASREFIRDCPLWLSATVWWSLLEGAPSEGSMIRTMQGVIEERIAQRSLDIRAHLVTRMRANR